jgi:hypothetical protein
MKIPSVFILALFLAGCASPRRNPSLTAEQAGALAVQLANHEASIVYHCQPFRIDQPASFVAGHWIWTEKQGFGHCDIAATVKLAVDGSTHNVDLNILDSENELSMLRGLQ